MTYSRYLANVVITAIAIAFVLIIGAVGLRVAQAIIGTC